MKTIDYKEIEFRGGLELHQQINTRKLFCECQALVRHDPPPDITKRKLHAVASELGEYDPAALHEAYRDRTFFYQSYHDSVCLVELDEEPPHPVNLNALDVVLQVSLMLNARIVDEIQVMRKTVIDGSNTAGFQRTMLVGTDGKISTEEGEVNLQYFCLEEDAARIIETNEREVQYRLDRLGIPLLEVVTGPNFVSPRQAGEVADTLGHIIRSVNVKRGIGSIRQDVNVSTKYGTRIEIKGVQRHRMIPVIMENEARRQVSLYDLAQELNKIGKPLSVEDLKGNVFNFTKNFRNSQSNIFRTAVENGKEIIVLTVPGFSGILGTEICPGKRLGTELKDQVLTLGIGGILHSDEPASRYGIPDNEMNEMKKVMRPSDNDGYILFAAKPEVLDKALFKLNKRLIACFKGVPKESRRALSDGNTQYMRPLPGEARMYPETDIPPVIITEKIVENLRRNLPENIEKIMEEMSLEFGISVHDLRKIEKHFETFIYGVKDKGLKPSLVLTVIGSNLVDKKRKLNFEINIDSLKTILDALKTGIIIKEAVPDIFERLSGGEPLKDVINSYSDINIDLDSEIKKHIAENSEILGNPKRHAILMGILMSSLRGKINGRSVSESLEKTLRAF